MHRNLLDAVGLDVGDVEALFILRVLVVLSNSQSSLYWLELLQQLVGILHEIRLLGFQPKHAVIAVLDRPVLQLCRVVLLAHNLLGLGGAAQILEESIRLLALLFLFLEDLGAFCLHSFSVHDGRVGSERHAGHVSQRLC